MHLLRFFSVAAVTASMALALPAEIPQVATSELQIVPAAEALANLPPADDVFVRNTPGDVSTKSSSYESESKALAICASPTRKNIFTITLRSTRAIFNGAINWAIKAYLDSQNGPSAFHMTPLESTTRDATATVLGYEYKKNFLGTDITRVTASVQFIFKAASGTIYTFLATIVYGIDTTQGFYLKNVELFDITSAAQKLPGAAKATKLLFGQFYDDYKEL